MSTRVHQWRMTWGTRRRPSRWRGSTACRSGRGRGRSCKAGPSPSCALTPPSLGGHILPWEKDPEAEPLVWSQAIFWAMIQCPLSCWERVRVRGRP
jgi:hypothetical protein